MNTDLPLFPEQASSVAAEVDAIYAYLAAVSIFFSVLIAALIVYFAIRYRRGSPADRTQGHGHFFAIEATWIIVPFLLTMIMFFWGADVYFRMARAPADAIEISTVAKQWMWKFQHPEGKSEINDLHVPLGRPVKLRMISEDVIHSFYVPAFRVKQDVLPGRYTTVWFEATRLGEYHLFCAEYCGAKHSEMKGTVVVLEPSQYQDWLAGGGRGDTPIEAGRKLFEERRCDQCHKPSGEPGRGPPLENLFGATVPLASGQSVVADEAYLRESILRPHDKLRTGYQPLMPTFEGQIGEEGLLHLIAYIKSLTKTERNAPQP
jgi:cytochrome c oxidase subunit 2